MATKTYVLNNSVLDKHINNSVNLSFLDGILWVEKEESGVSGPVPWKIDGNASFIAVGTLYKYNNSNYSNATLYGIWDLSGEVDLQNLPNSSDAVLESDVSGEFIGVVAIDEDLKIVDGPVFTKNWTVDYISLENIKVINNYAKAVYGTKNQFPKTFLGLSGELKSAGISTISLAESETYKNLCDIILAETIKSYLL
jgi:hypothetical protein